MVDFLFVAIYETFVKHETKISGCLEPLIYTIQVIVRMMSHRVGFTVFSTITINFILLMKINSASWIYKIHLQ